LSGYAWRNRPKSSGQSASAEFVIVSVARLAATGTDCLG
jgi:hypothetical protein